MGACSPISRHSPLSERYREGGDESGGETLGLSRQVQHWLVAMRRKTMKTARYHFITRLRLTSESEAVWTALRDVPAWPEWWRWCKRIDVVAPGDEDGIGGRYLNRIGSPLLYGFEYEVEIVDVVRPRSITVSSKGDLEGTGLFQLDPGDEGGTEVDFTWLVKTPKWWMSLLAPLGRRAFVWNHDKLMTDFGQGLANVTRGRLLKADNIVLASDAEGFFQLPTIKP
jgi:hypothetical protein